MNLEIAKQLASIVDDASEMSCEDLSKQIYLFGTEKVNAKRSLWVSEGKLRLMKATAFLEVLDSCEAKATVAEKETKTELYLQADDGYQEMLLTSQIQRGFLIQLDAGIAHCQRLFDYVGGFLNE